MRSSTFWQISNGICITALLFLHFLLQFSFILNWFGLFKFGFLDFNWQINGLGLGLNYIALIELMRGVHMHLFIG